MNKNLALFDLDHTLLDLDSDYTWGEFIVKKGLVDKEYYQEKNKYFHHEYEKGTLNPIEYNEFVGAFLASLPLNELYQLREEFIATEIKPFVRPLALQCIKKHRRQGDDIVIISATNDFVVSGIAQLFEIDKKNILASPLEIKDNRFTGQLSDKPNFKDGKIYHLNKWLNYQEKHNISYNKTFAYSDSHNDLPLLEWANTAICVTPDKNLTQIAIKKGWKIENWAITC